MNEINLGQGSNFIYKTAQTVTMWDHLTVINEGKVVTLDIKIEADFATIPEDYQEIFLNMMTSRYYGRASFGDNPFSQCIPVKKRKWWQLWK